MDLALASRYGGRVLRLELASVHTLVLSPLCARCPQGGAGCCAAPPAVAWMDIGRIVALGGRDFLLSEIEAGRLSPSPRGLSIARVPASGAFPERCTYLGLSGCRLPPDRRSATCNYYLCEDAIAEAEGQGDPLAPRVRDVNERLPEIAGRFDLELGEVVAGIYPDGPPWDAAFLDWLGGEVEKLLRRHRRALRSLA